MASKPGPFTQWPWHNLGNFKYVLLVPWGARSIHKLIMAKNEGEEMDIFNLSILPTLFLRLIYSQLWITISRFYTTRTKHKIVDKSLDFEQVDRERNWDDQILLTALLFFMANEVIPGTSYFPLWETKGVILTILLHVGPVEFIYYWLHRALHHHFLYSRYHSHHHASIVTEPITSVIHPFAEEVAYFFLFAIPLLTTIIAGNASVFSAVGYLVYIDFMNYLGHCNFELVPKWLFDVFLPLKFLMYTPSFHSLHHTQFRTNYSLFMPFYDYIYNTTDKSSVKLYETCLEGRQEEIPSVIHLTHLTTLQSIYHTRLGFASLSSKPYKSKWFISMMSPMTLVSVLLTWIYGSTFSVERNKMNKLILETWAIPRYSFQYMLSSHKDEINKLIEKAIVEAEERGVKVVSLGLLNQGNELNGNGDLYYRNNPKLKVKIVDGTSLAAAVVVNNIPKNTTNVLLVGQFSKVASLLSSVLCQKGIKVNVARRDAYEFLKLNMPKELAENLEFSENYGSQVWLVGDGVTDDEQKKAAKGVHFIPFSQFPPKIVSKDCFYHSTPALTTPKDYENMHTCENWLPRKTMSAWRVAGMVHALEEWKESESGDKVTGTKKVWQATLDHGFLPFDHVKCT